MKLAVSNIAWAPADAPAAYALLRARGIRGLEIAPAEFLDGARDLFAPTDSELARASEAAAAAGLELVSMQSLLFGVNGAALFGGADARSRFRAGIRRAIALARRLAIPTLVFGSPRQRAIPPGLAPDAARREAVEVFRDLGDDAGRAGCRIAIEPNPPAYGTNFLTDMAEADAFVCEVGHPAVTVNLDTSTLILTHQLDDIAGVIATTRARIAHVHLSEPDLAPAVADTRRTARVLSAMARTGYAGWYSVEMRREPGGGLAALSTALDRLTDAVTQSGAAGDSP